MRRKNRIRASRKRRGWRLKKVAGLRAWPGRIGMAILSLSTLTSLAILGVTLFQYTQRSSNLNVGEIKIMGTINATESELLNLAGVDFKGSLLSLDLKEISGRLARHPWVEKAKVHRDWSRKALVIEVQERIPWALFLGEDLYLLDRQGEVIKKAEPKDRHDLPVFTGLKYQEVKKRDKTAVSLLKQALEFMEILGPRKVFNLQEVSEIHLSKQSGLTVFTIEGGIPIRIGEGGLEDKIDRLEKVFPDVRLKVKDVEYIDLNYPRKVVVKMRTTALEKSRKA